MPGGALVTTGSWRSALVRLVRVAAGSGDAERRRPGARRLATAAITNAQLCVVGTVTYGVEHDGPGGIGDQPRRRPSGTQVTTGTPVALVVSSGLPQVATPNVVGLTQAAATTAITNAQSFCGRHGDHGVEHDRPGGIRDQPDAGRSSAGHDQQRGRARRPGLPKVVVPSVVGLTQTAATTSITNAQLVVGTVTTASSTTVPAGSVISQTPSRQAHR